MNPQRIQNQQESTGGGQHENLQEFIPTAEIDLPVVDPLTNNELEAFRLVNQRLLQQNEELLNLLQGPHQTRPAQGGPL